MWNEPTYIDQVTCAYCHGEGENIAGSGTGLEIKEAVLPLDIHLDQADIANTLIKGFEKSGMNTDNISDGQHTFGELYYHRMVLFSLFVNSHPAIAWKSHEHADGTMFDGYFIVGVLTPKGDYSYHYEDKFWDYFKCDELATAPEWDGHTPNDIDRLLSVK